MRRFVAKKRVYSILKNSSQMNTYPEKQTQTING